MGCGKRTLSHCQTISSEVPISSFRVRFQAYLCCNFQVPEVFRGLWS